MTNPPQAAGWCAELTAAVIVAEVADISRFKSEAAFARYIGVAPLPHSSGGTQMGGHSTRHENAPTPTRVPIRNVRRESDQFGD